ncbi:MAG: FUSC family protein [Geminicoccaceae bacterium]
MTADWPALRARAADATKVGLAMVLAYGIAMWMDWDRPQWAGFAVAVLAVPMAGAALNRGLTRVLGTLAGCGIGLLILGTVADDRWLVLAALSVHIFVCAYNMTSERYPYFWQVTGFTAILVAVSGPTPLEPTAAFAFAVARAEETVTGVLVYSLILVFWPRHSGPALREACRRLVAVQGQLFRGYLRLTGRPDVDTDLRPQRLEELDFFNRVDGLIEAARADTYDVWRRRHAWAGVRAEMDMLGGLLERWRAALREARQLDLTAALPQLDDFAQAVESRLTIVDRVLAGEVVDPPPLAVVDTTVPAHLSETLVPADRAALSVVRHLMEQIDATTSRMVGAARATDARLATSWRPPPEPARIWRLGLDGGRVIRTMCVVRTLWIAYFAYIFVLPPSYSGIVTFAPSLGMGALRTPQNPPERLLLPYALGSLFALSINALVLPQLVGFTELAALLFAGTFVICFLFADAASASLRTAGLIAFVILLGIENEQTYDFAGSLGTATMLLLAICCIVAGFYFRLLARPEQIVLYSIGLFFKTAARVAAAEDAAMLRVGALRRILARIRIWIPAIDFRAVPRNGPSLCRDFVDSLAILRFRLNELADARSETLAAPLLQEFGADLAKWQTEASAVLADWSKDPEVAPDSALVTHLDTAPAAIGERLEQGLATFADNVVDEEAYEALYRRIGALHGLYVSLAAHARLAAAFDFTHWREARF